MKGPSLTNLEFRSYKETPINYINKKTGQADTFTKRELRVEADDGTPIALRCEVPRAADGSPGIYACPFKKGDMIKAELMSFSVDRDVVVASALAANVQKG